MTDDLLSRAFIVLLSLAAGPLHGYAIIQRSALQSGAGGRLTASTLYDVISRLRRDGLIEETGSPQSPDGALGPALDSRRRYYQLTQAGRDQLRAACRTLAELVDAARMGRIIG
jgi:DNA-binding PadR family transcriptional regulator